MDVDSHVWIVADRGKGSVLQWSHVLMDVDSRRQSDQRTACEAASMEPRPDGRG